MKTCKDIELLLPLYSEKDLDDADQQWVASHLADCVQCRKELALLQEAAKLVDQLPDVEEPPWFQQKIMAGVREEAQKKSFVRKWFYPLRIKIPAQIMATLVIAILAVYVYRSGDEKTNKIFPGVQGPIVEMQQGQTQVQPPQAEERQTPTVSRKNDAKRMAVAKDELRAPSSAGEGLALKNQASELMPDAAPEADAGLTKGSVQEKKEWQTDHSARPREREAAKAKLADSDKKTAGSVPPAFEEKRESYKKATPPAQQSMAALGAASTPAVVLLHVGDLNAAVADVEKMLTRYDARIKSKKRLDGKMTFQFEISGRYLNDVLLQIRGMGPVEVRGLPATDGEQDIAVGMEIIGR